VEHGSLPQVRRAFTLLEIILVLALIGLIGGMLTAGVTRLSRNDRQTPEEVFWQSVRSAEKLATLGGRETILRFDGDKKALVWSDGVTTGSISLPSAGPDVSVQFLQSGKGSLILIAGQVIETQEVPWVRFFPEGTCTPFHAQLRIGANAKTMAIDPWTCAPVLDKQEAGR